MHPSSGYLGSIMYGGAECLQDHGQRARQDRARHYCACACVSVCVKGKGGGTEKEAIAGGA